MRIAYLLLSHKYPEQLVRLVHRLNTERTSFFVHFDKKSNDEMYRQIVRRLGGLPNVYFLDRQKVYWGDFSHLTVQINGMQEILSKDILFDYIIFLTGQDYPIKPNSWIENTLREHKPNSFIEYFALPDARWLYNKGGLDRVENWHFRLFGRRLTFPGRRSFNSRIISLLWSAAVSLLPSKREFPQGFKPFGGSAHWCLSRECAEYINDFVKRNHAFVNFFKYVYLPEEIFFQTIILNSFLMSRVINRSLWHVDWSANQSHPEILRKTDFGELARSSCLFARKFDVTEDTDVLDMIDHNLLSNFGKNQTS
jgi:hypothetical protein